MAVLLPRKWGGPVWWLGRLPAPPGFQHRVVAARGRSRAGPGARRLLLGGASAKSWLASITGLLLHEARFPALGWGRRPIASAGPVVPPGPGDRRAPGFLGNQVCSDGLDSRLPEPALPPPSRLRASGWSVDALEARGLAPACLAAPSGATAPSIGDGFVPGAAAARSGKPSSEGAPSIVVVALADTSGCCRPFQRTFLGRCAGPRGALEDALPRPPPISSESGGGARERSAGAAMAALSPCFCASSAP